MVGAGSLNLPGDIRVGSSPTTETIVKYRDVAELAYAAVPKTAGGNTIPIRSRASRPNNAGVAKQANAPS